MFSKPFQYNFFSARHQLFLNQEQFIISVYCNIRRGTILGYQWQEVFPEVLKEILYTGQLLPHVVPEL